MEHATCKECKIPNSGVPQGPYYGDPYGYACYNCKIFYTFKAETRIKQYPEPEWRYVTIIEGWLGHERTSAILT